MGKDGGGGIGSGPGISVGVALALHDMGKLAISVLGDGDFLMGGNAIWTAVHYQDSDADPDQQQRVLL